MKDVADRIGVSRQLVSIVMRDLPGASDETRRRVREAAAELGYLPDASARILRGKRSHQLGAMFTMHEPFEVDLVEALLDAAAARGYALALGPLTPTRAPADVVDQLRAQRVEGLFVLSTGGEASRLKVPDRVPAVFVGGSTALSGADDVRVDNAAGIELLVGHLADAGHTRIAYTSAGEAANAAERRSAYAAAMTSRGLEPDVVESAYSEEGGAQAAAELLSRDELPTAVMGANDRCAFGIMATLVRAGVRVPDDVSVVGFDDSSVARLPFVELTTVRTDPASLADRAVEVMLRRLDAPGADPEGHRQTPVLVPRGSVAPPRA